MHDFNDFYRRIASDIQVISFQTYPYRLFITTAYLQFAIRNLPDSPSKVIALEVFQNQLNALAFYYPESIELFQMGFDPQFDVFAVED